MKFHGGPSTLGLEMEYQILDAKTLDLADGILPLMRTCAGEPGLKPEMNQATVEVNTRTCESIDALEESFRARVARLQEQCRNLGLTLCGAGSHPFCTRLPSITPLPRYRRQAKAAGYLSRIMVTFGMHVHVGMADGDEAVRVMAALKPYLPLLLAASASSPFWQGRDSGHASFRQRILASMRSYGIPPAFGSWAEYRHFFTVARRAGIFRTSRDVHWDLRFQPRLGTLEVRAMDAQANIPDAVNLAAFVSILAAYLKRAPVGKDRRILRPLHWWLQKENFFRASRAGMEAQLIVEENGNCKPMRQVLEETLAMLEPAATEMGEEERLLTLGRSLAAGPCYVRQRRIFARTGSLKEVVAGLVAELLPA
jgi:carboxylate-amine ligase, YbdK family